MDETGLEEKRSTPRAAMDRLELDAGEQKYRTRTTWWKLWLPKNAPPPPRTSLADAPITPFVDASLLSKLTYSWITPLMVLGYQRTLQAPDLWRVHPSHESGLLSKQLDDAWERRSQKAHDWNVELEAGHINPSITKRVQWTIQSMWSGTNYKTRRSTLEAEWKNGGGKKAASLAWALNDVFGHMFWIGGAFKVFGDTTQMMGPLLIKAIINFAKDRASASRDGIPPPNIGKGIGMAIGIFCLTIVSSLTQHQFFWRSMTTGALARAALINSIYKRGVTLSGESRTQYTNSALINHISTDVSRIDAAAQWFHAGWTAPIQVLVCLIILLVQLGPSALTGFLLFFLVAPLQERVMAHRFTIRTGSMNYTDERAKTLLEVLNAMRIVKYFSYEVPFLKRIFETRKNELKGIRQMHHAQSLNTAFAYSIPVLASTVAFVTYTSTTSDFDAAIIFASLSLFQLLRQPMMFLPRSLSMTADAINALERLAGLFHAKVRQGAAFVVDIDQTPALHAQNATFRWEMAWKDDMPPSKDRLGDDDGSDKSESDYSEPTEVPFRVMNVNLDVPRGCLVAIVGRVGSGKSSLLQGLVGEMKLSEGSFSFGGRVAYCPQTAWIQNATLRDNVVFGQPFDEGRYWSAMESACMVPDLQMLPDGDLTEIGEKGINLSGGQKQRVNIARALYYDADIILFDDPLSAVDAHVGRTLFHEAILPLASAGKTVILVTHALHFLSHCDRIYTLDNGRIVEEGSYTQLISDGGNFARLAKEFGGSSGSSESPEESPTSVDVDIKGAKAKSDLASRAGGSGKLEGRLIVKEKRSTGSMSWSVYRSYLVAGQAYLTGPLSLIAIVIMQGSQILSTYTLVWWQENYFNRPFSFYQGLYAGLGISQSIFTMAVGLALDFVSTFVSKNLHNEAVWHIFHATMAFFDTTPTGRIMGIFGKDIDSIDNQLPNSMRLFVITLANVLGSVIIITVLQYYFIIAAFVIAFGYAYFSSFYRASAREMKRLDGMLRSLTYAHFSESLTGLPTIRSYGEIDRFVDDNKFFIDLENRALLLTVTNQRWLAVRLDSLGALLVFCIAIFAVVGLTGISPAQVGLVLTYSTNLTQLYGMMTRQSAEVEGYMNAVERVVNFSKGNATEQEAPHVIEDARPPREWPSQGEITFHDVSMSYRPGLPKVLRDISMEVRAGEKIGIVGRTGAGKSSLILALLRIVEFEGTITVDGLDISKMGLTDLRTQMALIPQDPTLFSGTVRTTLDPFSMYDDARLWGALQRSFLVERDFPTAIGAADTQQFKITLDTPVETEGANFSVGQRSLLSLARALVKDSKIVILDEATASVDVETDHKIQQTIQTEFRDKTLLCIAHRLRTIISYDRVLVLDGGTIAEFDTPLNLFKVEGGAFRNLCERSNISLEDLEGAVAV